MSQIFFYPSRRRLEPPYTMSAVDGGFIVADAFIVAAYIASTFIVVMPAKVRRLQKPSNRSCHHLESCFFSFKHERNKSYTAEEDIAIKWRNSWPLQESLKVKKLCNKIIDRTWHKAVLELHAGGSETVKNIKGEVRERGRRCKR